MPEAATATRLPITRSSLRRRRPAHPAWSSISLSRNCGDESRNAHCVCFQRLLGHQRSLRGGSSAIATVMLVDTSQGSMLELFFANGTGLSASALRAAASWWRLRMSHVYVPFEGDKNITTACGLKFDASALSGGGGIDAASVDSTASLNYCNGITATGGPGGVTLNVLRVVAAPYRTPAARHLMYSAPERSGGCSPRPSPSAIDGVRQRHRRAVARWRRAAQLRQQRNLRQRHQRHRHPDDAGGAVAFLWCATPIVRAGQYPPRAKPGPCGITISGCISAPLLRSSSGLGVRRLSLRLTDEEFGGEIAFLRHSRNARDGVVRGGSLFSLAQTAGSAYRAIKHIYIAAPLRAAACGGSCAERALPARRRKPRGGGAVQPARREAGRNQPARKRLPCGPLGRAQPPMAILP